MNLMDKVNRAIAKAGWTYSEANAGDYKRNKTQFSISHNSQRLHIGLELESHVATPANSRSFTLADVIVSHRFILYDGPSFTSGQVFPLYEVKVPGWDTTQLNGLETELEKVVWSEDDLIEATRRRDAAVAEFVKAFYP